MKIHKKLDIVCVIVSTFLMMVGCQSGQSASAEQVIKPPALLAEEVQEASKTKQEIDSQEGPPLFGVFEGLGATASLSDGTLTMEQQNWTPSPAGTWYNSSIWDETDVFHAQFDYDDHSPSGLDWRIKISRGGQLYSIALPDVGEIMPPQFTNPSSPDKKYFGNFQKIYI